MITPIPKPKKETKAEKALRKKEKHKLTKGFYNKQVKKLEKQCDEAWSLAIRKPCRCELCGQVGDIKSFDAHHLVHRANKATRWDTDNGVCLCKACHRFKVHMDTMSAAVLFEKLKDKRGQEWFENLECKRWMIWKPTLENLENIKKELETLCQK